MTKNEIPCAICANAGRGTLGDVTYCGECKHAFCDKCIVEHACEEFEYAILNPEEGIREKLGKLRGYLTHMLGAESHINKSQWGYRNYYCAGVGSKDEQDLMSLESIGLVRRGFTINEGESVYFFATEKGMDAIGLTKKQKARALEQ